jgi:hypothetical protein
MRIAFGRVLRTGLSSLRDRAAARLAALRINPSRVVGYAMMATPYLALIVFSLVKLGLWQTLMIFAVPVILWFWIVLAYRLIMR